MAHILMSSVDWTRRFRGTDVVGDMPARTWSIADLSKGGATMARTNASARSRASAGDDSAELTRFCHDLRQYVSAGLLLSKMPGDECLDPETHGRLRTIHQQLVAAADLIATADENFTPRRWQLDLARVVEECVKLVQITHPVSMNVDVSDHSMAYGDPALVRRALVNLLDNAARAAGRQGLVTVTLGGGDTTSWMEVADDGLGFGQIETGTGHGLPIVEAAMDASRGRLEISSGPGPGTRARMVLPAQSVEEQAS